MSLEKSVTGLRRSKSIAWDQIASLRESADPIALSSSDHAPRSTKIRKVRKYKSLTCSNSNGSSDETGPSIPPQLELSKYPRSSRLAQTVRRKIGQSTAVIKTPNSLEVLSPEREPVVGPNYFYETEEDSPSPVRANSKRRRSATPAQANRKRRRSGTPAVKGNLQTRNENATLSILSEFPTSKLVLHGVEDDPLPLDHDDDPLVRTEPDPSDQELQSQRSVEPAKRLSQKSQRPRERSVSRGRSRRRRPTPLYVTGNNDNTDSIPATPRRNSKIEDRESRSKSVAEVQSRQERPTSKSKRGPTVNELSLTGNAAPENDEKKKDRVVKGAFLVKKNSGIDKFKVLPPSSSDPGLWRPGDGFSGDEAKMDFLFYLTGKRKRKRPRSLPGIGRLSVSTDLDQNGGIRPSAKRPRADGLYQAQRLKLLRGEKKDVWPTMEDFVDGTLPVRQKGQETSEAPVQLSSRETPEVVFDPERTINYIPKSHKGDLDFRNFHYLSNANDSHRGSSVMRRLSRVQALRVLSTDDDMDEYEESYEDSEDDDRSTRGSPRSVVTSSWDELGNHIFAGDIQPGAHRTIRGTQYVRVHDEGFQDYDEEYEIGEADEDIYEVVEELQYEA